MYIDWAVNKNFAVLDVNIPQALTMEDVCTTHVLGLESGNLLAKGDLAKKREYDMIKQTEEICVYLWDNYIECVRPERLFGVGEDVLTILLGSLMQGTSSSWVLVMPLLVSCTFLLIEVTLPHPIHVLPHELAKLIFRASSPQNVVSALRGSSVSSATKTAPAPS